MLLLLHRMIFCLEEAYYCLQHTVIIFQLSISHLQTCKKMSFVAFELPENKLQSQWLPLKGDFRAFIHSSSSFISQFSYSLSFSFCFYMEVPLPLGFVQLS